MEAFSQPKKKLTIAHRTLSPTLQMLESQRLFATPIGQRTDELFSLLLAHFRNMVVDAKYRFHAYFHA